MDLLRRARIYVDTISISDDYMVNGSHGINVQTEDLFAEVDFGEFDMLVLPGGMPGDREPGTPTTACAGSCGSSVRRGKYVGAICAAPSILGNMGLLKGKRGTCFPAFEDRMSGAVLVKAPVVPGRQYHHKQGDGDSHRVRPEAGGGASRTRPKRTRSPQSIIYLK